MIEENRNKNNRTRKIITIQQEKNIISIEKDEIPGYEIIEGLGYGGMGIVWKAIQKSLRRIVAIKILNESLVSDSIFVKRFIREAEAIACVSHPNIVQIYDVAQIKEKIFYAMEYIDGKNLQNIIKEKKILSISSALEIALQVATALQEAHGKNIIHRDIKPQNILMTHQGFIKLTDFGLAKNFQDNMEITSSNMLLGSPKFMSPEQISDPHSIDSRTDIYSLGITLYHMLTGKFPFPATSVIELFEKIVEGNFIPIEQRQASLPASVVKLVHKMIQKSPDQRYPTAIDVIEEISSIMDELGIPTLRTYRNTNEARSPRLIKTMDLSTKKRSKVLARPILLMHKWDSVLLAESSSALPLQISTLIKLENSREKFWEFTIREGTLSDPLINRKILGKLLVFPDENTVYQELKIDIEIDPQGNYLCFPKESNIKKELPFLFQSHSSISLMERES